MKYKSYLWTLLLMILPYLADAATVLQSRKLNSGDGLPGNTIRCMYEDRQGFLWFGTTNGLSRYDGNTFLNLQAGNGGSGKGHLTLADNRIYSLVEDPHDCLWIRTMAEHYSCYDLHRGQFVDFTGGENKQSFTGNENKQSENAAPDDNYSDMIITSNGDVWLWQGTGNGALHVSMDKDRQFHSVKYSTQNGNLPDNRVLFVTEGVNGQILIGTQRGLAVVNGSQTGCPDRRNDFRFAWKYRNTMYVVNTGGTIYRLNGTRLEKCHSISAAIGRKAGITGIVPLADRCILLTNTGCFDYIPAGNHIVTNPVLGTVLSGQSFASEHYYWVYNHTGKLYQVDRSGKIRTLDLIPFTKMQFIDFERYSVEEASNGVIWISTYGNGLYAWHPQTGELEHFTAQQDGTGVISSDFLLGVMEDHSGGIWVSTEYSGIVRLTVDHTGVTRLFPAGPSLLDRSNSIRVIERMPDNRIMIGTRHGGLYTYGSTVAAPMQQQHLTTSVYALETDKQGVTWWGTRGDGLKIGDHWYRHDNNDPASLSHNHIFTICCDRSGRIWIGTFGNGLDLAVRQPDGTYRFRHFLNNSYGIRTVRCITEDNRGRLWVATGEGLAVFNPGELLRNPKAYKVFSFTNGKFCSNEIRCIYRDRQNRMWVGTAGGGLTLCELPENGDDLHYTRYTMQEGLVNNVVQSVQEDAAGHLWVATEYGISRFNPAQSAFENFFFASQTLGNVYSENCSCILPDGRLLFGTNYGVTVIDPTRFRDKPVVSAVVLTGLFVNGTRAVPDEEDSPLTQAFSYSRSVRLKHYQNSIRILFSTLNFSDNGQTKYTFYLEHYDKTWNAPTSQNYADYKYLNPGKYILHVKATNGAGVWNNRETTLEIVVTPPFWASIWAWIIYLLLAAGAAWMAFRLFRNFMRLRNRIRVEKSLTEYKLVFFTNISHEFRTPLTLMQGSLERLKRVPDLPQQVLHPLHGMEKSMNRMMRLINQLLEFRKMQNGKLALSLEETDVVAFLREIFQNFKDTAEQKHMQYHFICTTPVYRMYIDKEKLDKITYNILSNAFKYTPSGGTIELTVHIDTNGQKQLRIEVSDTGVGIPEDKQKELFKRFMQSSFSGNSIGIGLHLTHELVLVHKGQISYRPNEGGGSVFTVCIPTDKSVYQPKDFLVAGNVLLKEQEAEEAEQRSQVSSLASDEGMPVPINKQKILIIEDNEDIRQFLKEETGRYFNVETAADGKEGLEKAKECEPDLIVSDVLMPGMNGFEVTRRLKNDLGTSHIPIILLTALSSEEKHLEGIEAGADAYLPKPFSTKLLLARIFHLIEQRQKLRQKFSQEPGTTHAAICTSNRDKEFVDRMTQILEKNLDDPGFTVDKFAMLMKSGRTAFYKKIRGVTGYSPNEYLRIMRMKKGAELLHSPENYSVAEVAYKVGISDPFYFSKCFKAQFGVSPKAWQKGETASPTVTASSPDTADKAADTTATAAKAPDSKDDISGDTDKSAENKSAEK